MWLTVLIAIYCVLIVIASLMGGWLPTVIRLTHTRMQVMMSLVSGLMLGVALLHLLPHSVEYLHSISLSAVWMLAGLLVMFFLLRIFHFHQHEPAVEDKHDHHHDHAHHHDHKLSWTGLFFGLAVHTLLDGVAIGADVVAEAKDGSHFWPPVGLGTFLAVVLHKPLDAMSITSLMKTGGWTARSQMMVNVCFALMAPLGAIVFAVGFQRFISDYNTLLGCVLAFSAGFFLCIALGDLLPEVHFHTHDRIKLSMALLLGVAIAFGIELLHEHSIDHQHNHGAEHSHTEAGTHNHP